MNMIDSPMHAFLHYAILAGASPLVSGDPGVGKTTLLRALGNTMPYNNVVITVEDERELGLHLPRWDPDRREMVKRHAVCRPFESPATQRRGDGRLRHGRRAARGAADASPTWVLVGEVRGAYVTLLLEAATSGHRLGDVHHPLPIGCRRLREGPDQRAEGESRTVDRSW